VNWHIPLTGSPSTSLPVKRNLALAYRLSLIISALIPGVSAAGIVLGSSGLYATDRQALPG
jgi:hypothetical protein